MKNRKRVIVAFMLIACMLTAVGFAAVSDTFVITGNATITKEGANDAYNSDIRFEGIVLEYGADSDKSDDDSVVSDVLANMNLGYTASCNVPMDTASFHVNDLKAKGDNKTVIFRVRNYGEIESRITVEANPVNFVSGDENVFKVTHNIVNDTPLDTFANDGYVDIAVTITVNESVQSEQSCQFTVTFKAENDVTP